MKPVVSIGFVALAVTAWLVPTLAARAQAVAPGPYCFEGMLANGTCANPALGLGARDRAIIFGQPRLSMTAVVRTLPSGPTANDRLFRSPNNPITDSDRELDLLLGRGRP